MAVEQINEVTYSTAEDRDQALADLCPCTQVFSRDNTVGKTAKAVLFKAWVRDDTGSLVFKGWLCDECILPGHTHTTHLASLHWKIAKFEIWWRKLDGGDPMWVVYDPDPVSGWYLGIHIVWNADDVATVYAMPSP